MPENTAAPAPVTVRFGGRGELRPGTRWKKGPGPQTSAQHPPACPATCRHSSPGVTMRVHRQSLWRKGGRFAALRCPVHLLGGPQLHQPQPSPQCRDGSSHVSGHERPRSPPAPVPPSPHHGTRGYLLLSHMQRAPCRPCHVCSALSPRAGRCRGPLGLPPTPARAIVTRQWSYGVRAHPLAPGSIASLVLGSGGHRSPCPVRTIFPSVQHTPRRRYTPC